MLTVKLLSQNPDLRAFYVKRFPYMMVDEFQDTNAAQYRLAELICGEHKNLCVVGDDDQSIYKFRGATIENIMRFAERFDPKTIIIKLEQNYRSTGMILAAANSVISRNDHTIQKALWTTNPTGERVVICKAPDGYAEGRFAADTVKRLVQSGCAYSDFAVLYRINAQSNAFERAFSAAGIPYRIIGGLRFYDRKEIKDVLAYLHVLGNPRDMLHFRRIVNEPKRGIGEATLSMIEQIAVDLNVPPIEVCRESERFPQLEKKHAVLAKFADMIGGLSELLETDIPLADFIEHLLHKTGYKSMLTKLETEGENRLANIGELISDIRKFTESSAEADAAVVSEVGELSVSALPQFASEFSVLNESVLPPTSPSAEDNALNVLDKFLESIALYTDVDKYQPDENSVSLLTVHASKGLEWNTVFLVGMEEGIFPSARSMNEDIEEERRLAYVAITRAKERLFITHASERMLYGYTQRNPISRFIREIDKDTIEKIESDRDGTAEKSPALTQTTYPLQDQLKDRKSGKPAEKTDELFSPGERILHPKFGYGMVISAQAVGGDWMLEIMFEEVGTKKLMANFAKLKKA
jgi:DNA helicase-2/ATP-dependent DNA helicase PcrA